MQKPNYQGWQTDSGCKNWPLQWTWGPDCQRNRYLSDWLKKGGIWNLVANAGTRYPNRLWLVHSAEHRSQPKKNGMAGVLNTNQKQSCSGGHWFTSHSSTDQAGDLSPRKASSQSDSLHVASSHYPNSGLVLSASASSPLPAMLWPNLP